jgi:hypothetical protein
MRQRKLIDGIPKRLQEFLNLARYIDSVGAVWTSHSGRMFQTRGRQPQITGDWQCWICLLGPPVFRTRLSIGAVDWRDQWCVDERSGILSRPKDLVEDTLSRSIQDAIWLNSQLVIDALAGTRSQWSETISIGSCGRTDPSGRRRWGLTGGNADKILATQLWLSYRSHGVNVYVLPPENESIHLWRIDGVDAADRGR